MDLKGYIIDKSKELNIDIIGFTDCKPLDYLEDYLVARKMENRETEFEVEDIRKRIDPKLTFPNCNTIIVIAISYNNDYDDVPDYKIKGRLSKSTWGWDYHLVLKNKIERLVEEIKKVKDFNYRYFVDTGPLIDRELARKAGIGYYGKNCSIINDEYGSFIFIGYILTDMDISIDSPILENPCGECELCLKACPTGALEGPYLFNPKRCISYLTQTKDRIPYELREKMGISIYGCDICQLVCPENYGIKRPNHHEFLPNMTKGYIDLEELLFISNREFKEKYGSMAGAWRGKNILKRNAIIALGNIKDRDNLKLLETLLMDPSPMIREYAAWSILNTDLEYGRELVKEHMEEESPSLKREIENQINYYLTRMDNNY